MGSTGLDKMKGGQNGGGDPGVKGALDVDPAITAGYVAVSAEKAGVKFELSTINKMGRFEQELQLEMPAGSDSAKSLMTSIKPVCMGYEDFYAGWTADSSPCFSVFPTKGRMERRGGDPSDFEIVCKSDGQTGEKVGYLCVVLPDDDEQFTIKVTAKLF